MKTHTTRFSNTLLALAGSVFLTAQMTQAATLYWDGNTVDGGNPAANANGGVGNWNNLLTNWDVLAVGGADSAWTANDTAVFGGTAGTVTLTDTIAVGGLVFNTTGYVITTGANAFNFAATNNTILFNNIAAATITGSVGGAGNVTLSTSNPATAGTLTLNGTSIDGWSGTTTINAGMTLSLAGSNQGLSDTTGITLNGGGITLTNVNNTEGALDRVANGATITSNGGTITYTNTATGTAYAETLGTLALTRGQLNIVSTNAVTSGTQTLTLGTGSLTHAAANTSSITFAGASLGLNARNSIIVTSQATTAVGGIIGPWATWGTTAAAQTDYATYNITGGTTNAFGIQNANIAATAENTWALNSNVTLSGATTLTGTRTLNSLRYTGNAQTLALGASNFNLETYGLLNGGTGLLTVSTAGTGALTTSTGGGNLYLTTGNNAITVSAPINDNGGAVTVVKSGSNTLTLSSTTSNFTGGVVLNAGTLITTSNANLGIGGGVTVNGIASWNTSTGTNRSITINEGGVLTMTGASNQVYSGLLSGSGALASNTSNVYYFTNTGNSLSGEVTVSYGMFFGNITDSSKAINIGNTNANGGFGWTGGTKTLASRVFTLNATGNGYITSNGSGALVIEQDLSITGTAGARTLHLQGTNTGLNTFAGDIANGTSGGASVVSLTKAGAGNWYLSGTNTYSGATTLTPGNPAPSLTFQGIQALSPNTSIVVTDSSSSQTLLRILDDGVGTISRTTVPITFTPSQTSAAGVTNFFVGNNNTANGGTSASTQTNSIIALGGLTMGAAQAGNIGANINVTGANGYKLQLASIAFPDLSGKNAALTYTVKLNPTSAALIVAGNVTPFASTNTNAQPVLELTGTATGNEIQGNILDPSNVPTSNALRLTKTSASTWTLGGTNSYTGTTTISGGKLLLSSTGSLHASSAVTVSGGALGGTGTVNGTVTVSTTGGIDLRDNAVGNLTLASTLGITGAANANNLSFDLGNGTGTSDSILVAGTTSVTTANSAVVNLNQIGGLAGRNATTYTLIGGAGTLDATNFAKFTLATTKAFGQTYALVHDLVSDGGTGNLQVSATNVTSATAAAFWAGSTGVNWSSSTNWRDTVAGGGAVAGAPDYQTNVTFSTTTPGPLLLTTNVLDVDFDINSLTLTNASGNVTIGGTRMLTIEAAAVNGNSLGNGIDSQKTTGTNTISSKIALASSQSWTVASGGTLTVSGVVSDFGLGNSLTKAGLGNLNLSGVNTFTGATNITAGILNLTGASALAGTSGVSITSGASLLVTAVSPTLTANQTLILNGTGSTGSNGALATVTSGTTTWNGAVSLGSNSLVLAGSGTGLTIGGAVSLGSNTLTLNNASTTATTISGAISGSGGLIKQGTGTGGLVLTGANTYTGTTAIEAGTLHLNPSSAFLGGVLLASNAITISQGATLQFNPTVQLVQNTSGYSLASPITLTGGAGTASVRFVQNDQRYGLSGGVTGQSGVAQTLALFQGGSVGSGDRQVIVVSGAIADGASGGTLAVTVDFAGASGVGQNAFVNLTGQSTFTGNLIVNNSKLISGGSVYTGGWLTIGGERWVGNGITPGSAETIGTGYLGSGGVYNGNITINTGNGVNGTGITTLSFLSSANQTLGGTISGAGNLRQDGTGTLTLSGSNTFTGSTTIGAGKLVARSASALGSGATANVSVSAGASLSYVAATDTALNIGGTLTINGGTNTTIGGSVGSTATSASINVAGNALVPTPAVAVNVYGVSGVSRLAGTNTYTLISGLAGGATTLNSGTYTLGTVFNNTDFTVSNITKSTTGLFIDVTQQTALTSAFYIGGLSGATNVWAASNGSSSSNFATSSGGTSQALVPGSAASVIIDNNSLATATVLGADMSISGLTISDNTSNFALNADGYGLTIGTGGITKSNTTTRTATIASNIVLGGAQTWSNSDTGNALTISGIITGANNLIVDGAGNTNVSGRLLTGAGTLTKTGAGTLTLSNGNTYTGATTVNAGTLAVNGSITSAVTVASGATFGGSGSNTGTVSISGGGTFAAGNSIESLASGDLTLAAAAIFAYEMNNDAAAGVAGDLADVTGNFNLDLGNASILTLTELGSGSWTGGEKLTLVSYTVGWNGGLFNYGGTLADDSTISFSGINWIFNYNDTSAGTNYVGDTTGAVGFVTMTAIPEPQTALLGALGLLLLLRRRR